MKFFRVFVSSISVLSSAWAEGPAEWKTPQVNPPGVAYHHFQSASAGAEVSYHVLIPEGYELKRTERFPVLYYLHGTGGGLPGIVPLAKLFGEAIRSGKIKPMIVVFPNGMELSMWCDSKDGKIPVETVFIREIIPRIDADYRTLATREGRLIEGFSMGGYGAARLGLKYPSLFAGISALAAGPMQKTFSVDEGPEAKKRHRERALETVYGNDQEYFRVQSPWSLAEENTAGLRGKTRIRIVIGNRDETLGPNRNFDERLTQLDIPHTFIQVPGVGHDVMALFRALDERQWEFYRSVFPLSD